MTEVTTMKPQEVLGLGGELNDLIEAWQEAASPEELEASDKALTAYLTREVIARADDFRDYMVGAEAMADACKAQANRLLNSAALWRTRYERMEQGILAIMAASDRKHIHGAHSTFNRRGNGGLAPLNIINESLIPIDCCKFSGSIPGKLWASVIEQLNPDTRAVLSASLKREVDNAAIRAALDTPQGCPGARLEPRGHQLRVT